MARHVLIPFNLCVLFLICGCGSGGSSGSSASGGTGGSGSGGSSANAPVLTAIAPSSAIVGGPAITAQVYGTNFQGGATVQWNGTALTTTPVSATQLSVSLPASNFAKVGTASVTVSTPEIGTSNAQPFTIAAAPAAATWTRTVNLAPNSITWDAFHGELLASMPSTDPNIPNTVVPINPITGNPGTPVPAGNNPDLLSISSDGSYLWVGLDGDHAVQRFLLPGLSKDISFSVPSDPVLGAQQPVSLEAAPASPHTVALIAGNWGNDYDGNGVYVFDDATQRRTFVPGTGGGGPILDWIQWGQNDSTIYGMNGVIANLQVTASGVSQVGTAKILAGVEDGQYVSKNGLVYSYGGAYDLVQNSQVGQFDTGEVLSEACTADSSLNRYYCAFSGFIGGTDVAFGQLDVFDLNTYALLGEANLPDVTGSMWNLVRWGNAGLAFSTRGTAKLGPGEIGVIDGAVVNPNATPDSTAGTPITAYSSLTSISPQGAPAGSGNVDVTINGSNFTPDSVACWNCSSLQLQFLPTTYVSPAQLSAIIPASLLQTAAPPLGLSVYDTDASAFSSNGLDFVIYPASDSSTTSITALNLSGLDLAWDANSSLLYVGTADYDNQYPNAIVAVDPTSGLVKQAQTVPPDPFILSIGANGQYLYAAYAGASTMSQIPLPGLGSPLTWTLNNQNGGPFFAGDMKAAPVSPDTTVVALDDPNSQPSEIGGVAIYDNATQRPTVLAEWTPAIFPPIWVDTLAWGNSDSILAAAPNSPLPGAPECDNNICPLFTMTVDSSGANYVGSHPSFNTIGAWLHSDFGTGLVYSDDGNVANPATGATVGSYGASGLVAPDSTLNSVFILGQTSAQANTNNFTVESFNQSTFALRSSITLNDLAGSPLALVRWGASGLALLTLNLGEYFAGGSGGTLYILQDSGFVSHSSSSNLAKSVPKELVQQRWKRLSRRDIRKLVLQRASEKIGQRH